MPSPIRRSTRGAPALTKSTPPASNHSSSSLSSEPPRRSQRSQPSHKDASPSKSADPVDDADDEPAEEEEITRCICGQQEYPGAPLSEAFTNNPDATSEDAGGLFILCDGCSVWQHGGCVGIVEESQSPDKYYCEECRPKLHELHTDSRGQKYSLYLPLHPRSHRKPSISKHDDKAKKERENAASRTSVDPSTGKRRATMRSKEHDDEEEQLKRAIEESKREVEDGGNPSKRNGKRSRDESEESVHPDGSSNFSARQADSASRNKPEFKRQRTASESLPSVALTGSHEDESESDLAGTSASRNKKAKAEAAQSARQAEQREKDKEREKARAEAAGRRQERAGRRRGDEPADTIEEETPKPTPTIQTSPPPLSSQPPSPPPAERVSHKKGAGRKLKKLGNNQYTKNRGEALASSPHGRRRHEKSNGSGDETAESPANGDSNGSTGGAGSKNSPGVDSGGPVAAITGKGKFGKGRKGFVNGGAGGASTSNGHGVGSANGDHEIERTFTNMKSALDAMSAWVSRQQTELTRASPASTPVVAAVANPAGGPVDDTLLMVGGAVQPPDATAAAAAAASVPRALHDGKSFDDLTSTEMALRLQHNIAAWQEKWGHLA